MLIYDERCRGCRCESCRWRAAGSNCYYNAYGQDSSRCSQCAESIQRIDLAAWKVKKLCVQGLREKADKIRWVKKQELIGATAH